MAFNRFVCQLSSFSRSASLNHLLRRNIGFTAVTLKKMDPVQQIFADTINEYKTLSAKQGGGAVDAGADYEQRKHDAITRLGKVYNVDNPTQFPDFQFKEPDLNQDEV